VHWLLNHSRLLLHHWLLLDENLLLLDWLLDVDVFFDVLVHDVATTETNGCDVTVAEPVGASVVDDSTVLSSELLFLLEQFGLSLLFLAVSLLFSGFLLSQ
jgi:hypothetical protein